MAFFGLTALGPSDPFKAEYKEGFTVELFEKKEFEEAYEDVLAHRRKKASKAGLPEPSELTLGDVPDIFRIVFHGPPPTGELDRAAKVFSSEGKRDISMTLPLDLFLAGIEVMQETAHEVLEKEREKAAHYVSLDELRGHRNKGVTSATGPVDNYRSPMTLSNDIGFFPLQSQTVDKRYPKTQCAETKFASLLRASGYY
jgi:hypothetical protein